MAVRWVLVCERCHARHIAVTDDESMPENIRPYPQCPQCHSQLWRATREQLPQEA